MSAEEFDHATLREVQWRIEAESGREDREFERIAQLACWVMNPWIENQRDKMHVGKLLKRRVKADDDDWLDDWLKD